MLQPHTDVLTGYTIIILYACHDNSVFALLDGSIVSICKT